MEKKNEAERDWVTSAKPHGQCEGELRVDITIFGSFPVTVLLDRQTDRHKRKHGKWQDAFYLVLLKRATFPCTDRKLEDYRKNAFLEEF